MSVFTEKSEEFLFKYLENASPSGFEREGQKIWANYIKDSVDEIRVDNYGSVTGVINPEADFKVVIEAHADEIGWTVKYIAKDGLIYLSKLGGSDVALAPGNFVNIHTKSGIVEGVIGAPAVHVRGKDYKPMINTIAVDVGVLTDKRVEELGVEIGDPVIYQTASKKIQKRIVGRGLDNRIGGFVIARVAKMIKENNVDLPFGLYISNAVQEEVGKNGAKMLVESIKPNIAIVTDVTHDTSTPGINKTARGDYKVTRGPVITSAPPIQKQLLEMVETVAKDKEIKYQKKTAEKITGTDADVFAYGNGGTPTVLISLPLRYMHTAVEMVSTSDVEKLTHLIYETLLTITPDVKFNVLDLDD